VTSLAIGSLAGEDCERRLAIGSLLGDFATMRSFI
jgi:hypothetical protein